MLTCRMEQEYSQQLVNEHAAKQAAAHPDFDGTNVPCGVYEEVFRAATFGGDPARAEDYMTHKALEIAAVLRLMSGKNIPAIDDYTANMLVMLLSSLILNIDLERLKSNIKPCGSKGCKCHETKFTVVHSLTLIKSYMNQVGKKDSGGLEFVTGL